MNADKMESALKSALASQLRSFFLYKQSQGYRYMRGEWCIPNIDKLLAERDESVITPETARAWMADAARRGPHAVPHRATFLRQLCLYLHMFDPRTYIPPHGIIPKRPAVRPANIFTMEELSALFEEARNVETEVPGGFYIWMLLLYTCGLRPAEGRRLELSDVNIEDGVLRIRQTKFKKSRYVPMSSATCGEVKEYYLRRVSAPASQNGDRFILFAPYKGDSHSCAKKFALMIRTTGIRPHPGCRHPRQHDMRHTFAVHSLLRWYRSDPDVQARLPVLATYMGHAEMTYTEKYLQATSALLDEANARFRARCAKLVEVCHE